MPPVTLSRRDLLGQLACWPLLASSARLLAASEASDQGRVPAQAVTQGPKHHFFGYYDKTPWDQTGRYLLGMEIDFINRQPKPGETLTLGMVDLQADQKYIPFATTAAWSWQQGTMLQWLGAAPDREVIYNSIEDGQYVARIQDVHAGKTRTLPQPVYALSRDGQQAVTLDFARLNRLRPGYGYVTLSERYADDPAPRQLGIVHMNLKNEKHELIIPLAELPTIQPRPDFQGAYHWVNHLQFNPSGSQFLFLHRWRMPQKGWKTRLLVAKPDGSDLKLIIDHNLVSHFDWQDDTTILAWSRSRERGDHFYRWDITGKRPPELVGAKVLVRDGHCSYSPDRQWILNDTYPDAKRLQTLMLYRVADGQRIDLNQFYLPPKLTGPFRCDLHPRWNRSGTQVCIDSAHEGSRQMYILDVSAIVDQD